MRGDQGRRQGVCWGGGGGEEWQNVALSTGLIKKEETKSLGEGGGQARF